MKTALYDRHEALGAKLVDFAGWEMPVRYAKGTLAEHQAVREAVGLFDVSHMGRIVVRGPDAERLLDYLSTNKITGKRDGAATYTVWAAEDGGSVDDVIVYRQTATEFFVVANASNRQKDLDHVLSVAKNYDVVVETRYEEDGILALQGPKADEVMAQWLPEAQELKFMRLDTFTVHGENVIIARTGYTGESGYEIMPPNNILGEVWDELIALGAEPCGLGARDTLRLEMGFALYGHELSDTISATESVSSWTVKLGKETFLGKEALVDLELNPQKRSQQAVVLREKGIAREGCRVFSGDLEVGIVTSGTHSPTLNRSIAIVMVSGEFSEGDQLEIEVRKQKIPAEIVKLPFLKSLCKK